MASSGEEEDYVEEEEDVEEPEEAEEEAEYEDDNDDFWLSQGESQPVQNTSNAKREEDFFTKQGSKEATTRLVSDINSILKSDPSQFGYSAGPINDNLYIWSVKFFGFDPASPIGKDLERMKSKGIDCVELEMRFPAEYPWKPPFIYVKRPRFEFRTGHVTLDGSICMELLTASGWTPANDIESILVQIRSEMLEGGARLDFNNTSEYTEEKARSSFLRAARLHGWEK